MIPRYKLRTLLILLAILPPLLWVGWTKYEAGGAGGYCPLRPRHPR